MTSWRNFTSLFLLVLPLIELSEEGCLDYLSEKGMAINNLSYLVPLVKANSAKNTLLCTLENGCRKFKNEGGNDPEKLCSLFYDCFPNDSELDQELCQGFSGQNISVYNLRCLIATAINQEIKYKGCNYDNVCSLYSELKSMAAALTNKHEADNKSIHNKGPVNMMSLLMISMILNLLLPLTVYLLMRMRTQNRTQDRIHMDGLWRDPGDRPLEASEPTSPGNEVETMQLMQPTECHSVVTTSADTIEEDCTVGNSLPG
ncbi:uncharacterized protein LOC111662420 [Seriola lalandi dorsalis]|uniref:uncharacterized protein LOC111662420 n=1 Tax=Seriola lalandi dorsalis TaxID=1841481 RepID=UPI000C6F92A0|nr:uncharacterized protein LOC111662420 [Seriola lalandi dorsalis]